MTEQERYERGEGCLTHTDSQEELERAKAGLGPVTEHQSFDPRRNRTQEQADPNPAPPPVTVDSLLETWYWYRTVGRIAKAMPSGIGEMGEGQDEALLSTLYVESTPGYSYEIMRPILLHKLDGKPWAIWYGRQPKVLAKAMFDGFKMALAHRLENDPFVIYRTRIHTPDHLEVAEQANAA